MRNNRVLLLAPLLTVLFCCPTRAQGYFQFLGPPSPAPDQVSQRYGIRLILHLPFH
jgi:hypothetical protein